MSKFVDSNGLLYLWQKIKAALPKKTSDLQNDSGYVTAADIPEGAAASTTTPKMAGTAAVGSETAFARGDHIHPSDTSKVDKVAGKGLSTNDYTTADKNKLAGVAANANNYSLPTASAGVLGGVKVGANLNISGGVLSAVNTTYGAATSSAQGLMSAADKAKLDAFGASSSYALKADLTAMYRYKGSVSAVASLPASGNTVGDVYNVEANGMNYAWNGTAWDALGETFTIESISNADIDSILAT